MNYIDLRNELKAFYWPDDGIRSRKFAEKCFKILDEKVSDDMTVTQQKLLQYDVLSEEFEPVIFRNSPFYFETGMLSSCSDGSRNAKNLGFVQANGWVFSRNSHLYIDQNPELWKKRCAQSEELLYLICGMYNDDNQHFNFNNRPILEGGLKGVYEKAEKEMVNAETDEQTEFLKAVCHGMLTLKKMSEKFSAKAYELLEKETDEKYRENLKIIAETAKRVPWEKPKTLYEALATLAFIRKAIGSLEGNGPNTFGRVDMDLYPFYKHDIERGILTPDKAYELICEFLIIWDMHYDHDSEFSGYGEHELENTYCLGGCDLNGEPVYNELTNMFLKATREEKIIFPKIKCRFSKNSPKEYLDEINISVIKGTSTILYQNDDTTIPAFVRSGKTLDEARDYIVSGCWGVSVYQEKYDHANYTNLLKAFEFALHNRQDKMEKVGIRFETFDNCKTFDELYDTVLNNSRMLIKERLDVGRKGGQIFGEVVTFPILSSTLENCIENKADFTMNGTKYRDDHLLMIGLPNIVDSLLAIKTLVFDTKKYTLDEILTAVRNNWEGYEDMRMEAIRCHGWGDGSKESCELANRFNNDLYTVCSEMTGCYGGKVHLGHLTYTEIRWWGEKTLATPDGRRNGDYFAQGLTPSRLKKIPCVTDVINSMASLDASKMAANSVVNIILPSGKTTLDICEGFLRAVADSAVQALQLNCTSKQQLLDAQKHPEDYPDLIVRVTGFSAKFTSLSKGWQEEVISRNFYE